MWSSIPHLMSFGGASHGHSSIIFLDYLMKIFAIFFFQWRHFPSKKFFWSSCLFFFSWKNWRKKFFSVMKKKKFSLKNAAPNKFLEDVLFLNKSVTYSKLRLLDKEKQERKFSFTFFSNSKVLKIERWEALFFWLS